jgi:hypothetical protein
MKNSFGVQRIIAGGNFNIKFPIYETFFFPIPNILDNRFTFICAGKFYGKNGGCGQLSDVVSGWQHPGFWIQQVRDLSNLFMSA